MLTSSSIKITQPDDFHLHLRDGAYLERTVADTAKTFARAIIMPNLKPPVTKVAHAKAYRERILAAIPTGYDFEPLMTLYLTQDTSIQDMIEAKQSGFIYGCKLYPQGATTNTDQGIASVQSLYPIFEAMEKYQIILQIHGEVVDSAIDIFDREEKFIDSVLINIIQNFPNLKIVLEHITTEYAVNFVKHFSKNCAATITAHHLYLNRNDLLAGGIKPHYYCLPIVKKEQDRQTLIQAAISGNTQFFLGTDSAPHAISQKESACGCAGIYTAHAALEFYAEIFEKENALDKLEAFASFYGADFYGLPRNSKQIELAKEPQSIPEVLTFGEEELVPFKAGQILNWKIL